MLYLTPQGIRKYLITNYYLIAAELIVGLMIIYFAPQIPLMLLIYMVLINLALNFFAQVFYWNRAPMFFMQAFIILEMLIATLSVSAFAHYFTDVRPSLILGGYVPIILFATNLDLRLGVITTLLVGMSYLALSYIETAGIWPIAHSLLVKSSCFDWQKNSFANILIIVMIGIIALIFKHISSKNSESINNRFEDSKIES